MASHGETSRRAQQFTFFFTSSAFSQHSRCRVTVDDITFDSALHYMLYEKASEYAVQVGNYDLHQLCIIKYMYYMYDKMSGSCK